MSNTPNINTSLSENATIIVALISLLGVIASLLWNNYSLIKSEQRKFKHEFDNQVRQREEDIKILRAVMGAEIRNIQRIFSSEENYIKDVQNGFTWIPIGNFFQDFQAKSIKLGFLNQKEIDAIMQCYYVFQEEVGYLVELGEYRAEPVRLIGCEINTDDQRRSVLGPVRSIAESAQAAAKMLADSDHTTMSGRA